MRRSAKNEKGVAEVAIRGRCMSSAAASREDRQGGLMEGYSHTHTAASAAAEQSAEQNSSMLQCLGEPRYDVCSKGAAGSRRKQVKL